jgi:PHD/YefM family antitoxin component YafN of YafNO toxin-antitoxin module
MTEESIRLKGVQYVIDTAGKRTAVLISLEEWGELWEDIYDVLVSQAREDEPTVSWETLKAEMVCEALPSV